MRGGVRGGVRGGLGAGSVAAGLASFLAGVGGRDGDRLDVVARRAFIVRAIMDLLLRDDLVDLCSHATITI